MKTVEATNPVRCGLSKSDGQMLKLELAQGGEHGFITMAALFKPHQAYRLSAIINQMAQELEAQEQAEGARQ